MPKEGGGKRKKKKNIFEVIMTENFSTLMTDTTLQTQEAQRRLSSINNKKLYIGISFISKLKKPKRKRKP